MLFNYDVVLFFSFFFSLSCLRWFSLFLSEKKILSVCLLFLAHPSLYDFYTKSNGKNNGPCQHTHCPHSPEVILCNAGRLLRLEDAILYAMD
ncbi:hypothetical protein QBC41DRAFT_103688 [Cercophora samala]|uniref:Uncharacterized protein n=1 Tax=Cercophora samala TaxID=330535 RepID=A0AA39ZMG1_9PEZI|nr:hypothetical protein QBC41DRAFT_103688 [Cercophora samala]